MRDGTPDDSHAGPVRILGLWIRWVLARATEELIGAVIVAVLSTLMPQVCAAARSQRRMRRVIRRIGARDGQVVFYESGSGVFCEGPYWRNITTLRTGTADDLWKAQLGRAASAGYQLQAVTPAGSGCTLLPRDRLPELAITVLPEGALLGHGRCQMAHGPKDRRPELIWDSHGTGPGWGRRLSGAPRRYATLSPPVVPPGTIGICFCLRINAKGRP
jgi:hypothetical protein